MEILTLDAVSLPDWAAKSPGSRIWKGRCGRHKQLAAVRGQGRFVRADLPGLSKDDINVDITDDAIRIRGERQQEREENKEGYYRSERSYGSFYREVPLPNGVKREEANATFRNGVLEITMPAPARQPSSQRIEISEGAATEQQPKALGKAAGR